MANRNNISDLFNINGCLKQSTIIRYIDKALDDNHMQHVAKHLDKCPLCREALEGIEEAGIDLFVKNMDELRSRFQSSFPVKQKKNRSLLITTISVAASAVIIAGVLYFFNQIQLMKVKTVAETSQNSEDLPVSPGKEKMQVPQTEIVKPAPVKKAGKTFTRSEPATVHSDIAFKDEQQSMAGYNSDTIVMKQEYTATDNYVINPSSEEESVLSDDENALAGITAPRSTSAGAKKAAPTEKSLIRKAVTTETDKPEISFDNVLMQTDKMPFFEGGDVNKFIHYIQKEINDSVEFPEGDINKSLIISFVVDTLGRPVDINMLNSNNKELNNVIIRLFQASPDWKPGIKKGVKTSVKYTINLQVGK